MENVSRELESIMETGYFKLIVKCKPKRIMHISKLNVEEVNENYSGVFLHQKQRHHLQGLSPPMSAPRVDKQSCESEIWNQEQIDDFVRKLGFLENQTPHVYQQVKLFQQQSQVWYIYFSI